MHESHLGAFPLETAFNTDDVKSELLMGKRNIARSDTVTMPTIIFLSSIIGSLRIPFFSIISTTFSIVVEGSAVINGYEAKFSSTVLRDIS